MVKNEVDSPHFGNNSTETQEVSQCLSPGSELQNIMYHKALNVKSALIFYSLHGRQMLQGMGPE